MQFKKLGTTDIDVSLICLGTMTWGEQNTKEDAFDLTINTIEKNIETIKTICKVVTKYNKKLIIKLHPSPDEFDPTQIVKEINPEIKIVKTGKISQLIKNSSIVVVIDESSAIIDAH